MPPKKKSSHVARMAQQMERRKAGNQTHGVREAALVDTSGDGRIDAREGMATTVFTVESLNLKSTNFGNYKKKGKGKGGTYKRAATTVLAGEATYDVERRVRDARRALFSPPVAFEETTPGSSFDLTRSAVTLMPARPKWDYELGTGRLHSRERKAFVRWISSVKKKLIESGKGYAPAFEQNIEVWRQLWRVLERADVAVLVVDARHPMLHTPPALYAHIVRRLKKPLVLVLNKVDAIPRAAAEIWAEHLLAALPGVDAVVGFSSKDGGGGAGGQRTTRNPTGVPDAFVGSDAGPHAGQHTARDGDDDQEASSFPEASAGGASEDDSEEEPSGEASGPKYAQPDRTRFRVGHVALLQICRELVANGKRNVTGSSSAAAEEAAAAAEDAAAELEAKAALKDTDRAGMRGAAAAAAAAADGFEPRRGPSRQEDSEEDDDARDDAAAAALHAEAEEAARAKDGRIMIGLVGHPNVGKSSMVNYILGRKAVSVKATPGHTKTLQTLILDEHTCLCDSPGLVFPRVDVGLAEQIVGGLVPLPVVREPYSALRWVAELRDSTGDRWTALARASRSPRDRALATALATSLAVSLKVPRDEELDIEVLEPLRGGEDLLDQAIPWSPMSLCRAYGKMRGFTRGGNSDTFTAGMTVLSLVLEGRVPYAVPPPEGEPVVRRHIGVDGKEVETRSDVAARMRSRGDAEAATPSDDDVSEASEVSEDEEDVAAFNPFRALGIDAEGEAQYGTADIDADEGSGRFKVKLPKGEAKGAAATYFGRGGTASQTLGKQGGGGSVFLSDFDLKESTKGTREKGGRKSRR
jgi:ribosome biogenesis GTPase A